jgi:predicted nuclease of restriction endonuclease-like RecB superfamily
LDTLIFPDFLVQHRLERGRRFLLEILGFWTPEYVDRKLRRLRAAGITNLILAVDEERGCADDALPPDARVIGYRRRIDPLDILAIVVRAPPVASGATP